MRRFSIRIGLTTILLGSAAVAQTTTMVSRASNGAPANNTSEIAGPRSISGDGRFVVFRSPANNLVAGDTLFSYDVFVHDRQTGATELVSQSSGGVIGNDLSGGASISDDGRFVLFTSAASNLVAQDTNAAVDVFLRDRLYGTTRRVSLAWDGAEGNNHSYAGSISEDGQRIAFTSVATNLVPGDLNQAVDVFVRDRVESTTTLESVSSLGAAGNADSGGPSISGDGRFLAFASAATNLVPSDTNGWKDIFVRDRQTGSTALASVGLGGAPANGDSTWPSISADGCSVAFNSLASNLILSDPNGDYDVFVRDLCFGNTELMSRTPLGGPGGAPGYTPSISADGSVVAFYSWSWDFVPDDTNSGFDVFVARRFGGPVERVSVTSDGGQAAPESTLPSISRDGRFVAFNSRSWNLVPNDSNAAVQDVFVRDRAPSIVPFCSGDGTAGACPCGNGGAEGHGCQNSASTGGAILGASGAPSLAHDTLSLASTGGLPSSTCIFLQGSLSIAPVSYGDGLRCIGGSIKRLYLRGASGGAVTAPIGGELAVSARSAALADTIPTGASRYYQVFYRDPNPSFCAAPAGNTWNVSSGVAVAWGY